MSVDRTFRQKQERVIAGRTVAPINPRNYKLDIDLGPDVTLRLVRRFFHGREEDPESYFRRIDAGWVPVPESQIPEKYKNFIKDGVFQKDGCVLCKIDRQTSDSYRAYYEDLALGLESSARKEFGDGGHDSRIPRFANSDNSTRVIKGRKPNS